MRMTKLGHSCVRLERDGRSIVLDPGVWSGADPMAGASAILITHEHADHLDSAAVQAAMERDAGLELWTNAAVAGQFAHLGNRVHAVGHGDAFTTAGFDVRRGVPSKIAWLPLRFPLVEATKVAKDHVSRRMLVIPTERLAVTQWYFVPLSDV